MAKHTPIFILLSSLFIISPFSLPSVSGKRKTANLRLFLHDKINRTAEYDGGFTFDAPLTTDFSPWGRVQATVTFLNANNHLDVFVSMAFILNGTLEDTLVAVGRINLLESFHQLPIVGGTGVFTTARGIVTRITLFEQLPVYLYVLKFIQDDILSSPIIKM